MDVKFINFTLIYLLLFVILYIMQKAKISLSKKMIIASIKMTVQLVIAGIILTIIFENNLSIGVIIYIPVMAIFAIKRALSINPHLNKKFKIAIATSLIFSTILALAYLVIIVLSDNLLNPRVSIPISGMIIGNAMTGVSIGIKSFSSKLLDSKNEIETLQNLSVNPQDILNPIVGYSLETAILPTLNTMLGMGIVSLPGMMTGQILSGAAPLTAIMYQISIMIAICTANLAAVFFALKFGSKTLITKNQTIDIYYLQEKESK